MNLTPEQQQKRIARQQHHEWLVGENQRAHEIAVRLDTLNPELRGAFTGTPTERIERQVEALLARGGA